MANLLQLMFLLIKTVFRLNTAGGVKALAAENICLRQQLITLSRTRERSPNLSHWDRFVLALSSSLISPKRLSRIAIMLKPATLIKIHKAFVKRKYSLIFSNKNPKKPGRKGPSDELKKLVLEIKKYNPRFGCCKIAMQIKNQFNIEIDKDVVRRILEKHYKNSPDDTSGPSWLTFLGHSKDSLWSLDLFRCESITLQSHWVMVVMDQFSRKIIGFTVHKGHVDGIALCRMFAKIIVGKPLPKIMSEDNDPLFTYYQYQANLRILDVETIKSVPFIPMSHPFIERLILSIRTELLDQVLFWTADDLHDKLSVYKEYFNSNRSHMSLDAKTPEQMHGSENTVVSLSNYRWKKHVGGLVKLPEAA